MEIRDNPTVQPPALLITRQVMSTPPQAGGNEPAQLERPADSTQTSALPATAAAGVMNSRLPPVVKEVRNGVPFTPEPGMVWRKSVNAAVANHSRGVGATGGMVSGLPLTTHLTNSGVLSLARQVAPVASSTAEPGLPANAETSVPVATSTTQPAPSIDVEQLADQVSRIIFRQLLIERERRGIGKWR